MKHAEPTTIELLENWHRGDSKALEALLERNLTWIRARVRSRLGPLLRAKEESSDVVQDVVVEFLRYGPRFLLAHRGELRALLVRIVENVIRADHDRFTAQRRSLSRERPLGLDTVVDLTQSSGTRSQPLGRVIREEEEAILRLCLDLADPDDRALVLERHWERLSFDAIGKRRGLTADGARMRLHRALARISKWIHLAKQGELPTMLETLTRDEGADLDPKPTNSAEREEPR